MFIPPHPSDGLPSLLIPFDGTGTDVVWFGVHDIPPNKAFVQIVEWDATSSSLKTLSAGAVPVLHAGHPETLLVLTKGATTIAIDTDLGPSIARQVAGSLQPLATQRGRRVSK